MAKTTAVADVERIGRYQCGVAVTGPNAKMGNK